jgi:hypothetical protein
MKLPYTEGTVFLVPLKNGGHARGVVARATAKGKVLLGYFFGPPVASNDVVQFDDLKAANALLRARFGDLGLINGEWSIKGTVPNWNRSEWPMPDFVRRDPLSRLKPILVRYSDTDPMHVITEIPVEDDIGLETDALSGYRAIEIKLNKLIE